MGKQRAAVATGSPWARHWAVLAAGGIATALAMAQVREAPGVYWVQTDVRLMLPLSVNSPNGLQSPTESLITTAGVVARVINGPRPSEKYASSAVRLVDRGVTSGREVRLPDTGGQWATNFREPVLDIQVVGPSPEDVMQRLASTIAEVNSTLETQQVQQGVAPKARVRTLSSPTIPRLQHERGAPARAALAVGVLGVAATGAVASSLQRRRLRRPPQPAAPAA